MMSLPMADSWSEMILKGAFQPQTLSDSMISCGILKIRIKSPCKLFFQMGLPLRVCCDTQTLLEQQIFVCTFAVMCGEVQTQEQRAA